MNFKLPKSLQSLVLGLVAVFGLSGVASATQVSWGHDDLGTISAPYNHWIGGDTFAGPQYSSTDTFFTTLSFNTLSASSLSGVLLAMNSGNLNISGLSASLYSGIYTGPGQLVESSHSPSPSAGFAVLDPVKLGAGHYYMAITGSFNGKNGGWYAGAINLSPVPEAEVWALFLVGLTFIGFVMFRRSKEQFSNPATLA